MVLLHRESDIQETNDDLSEADMEALALTATKMAELTKRFQRMEESFRLQADQNQARWDIIMEKLENMLGFTSSPQPPQPKPPIEFPSSSDLAHTLIDPSTPLKLEKLSVVDALDSDSDREGVSVSRDDNKEVRPEVMSFVIPSSFSSCLLPTKNSNAELDKVAFQLAESVPNSYLNLCNEGVRQNANKKLFVYVPPAPSVYVPPAKPPDELGRSTPDMVMDTHDERCISEKRDSLIFKPKELDHILKPPKEIVIGLDASERATVKHGLDLPTLFHLYSTATHCYIEGVVVSSHVRKMTFSLCNVNVNGWLEAFTTHLLIEQSVLVAGHGNKIGVQWSKEMQSTALATANDSTLQKLSEWHATYIEKLGFVFLICASGRSSPKILAELKHRFSNMPIVEFEMAVQERMYKKEKERVNEIRRRKKKRKKRVFDIQKAKRRSDLARVPDMKYVSLQEIEATIAKLESVSEENMVLTEIVGPEQIAEVVSRWTEIPVTQLGQNDKERLVGLGDRLHKRVVGQDQVVKAVAEAVLRSRVGLCRPQHPTGSFLFMGPTGVGKTELGKALSQQLFDDENLVVRIDMCDNKGIAATEPFLELKRECDTDLIEECVAFLQFSFYQMFKSPTEDILWGFNDVSFSWERFKIKEFYDDGWALASERMMRDQLEKSGGLRRMLASRVMKPTSGFELLVKHRQSVTAVALTEDDTRGFSASKDGTIVHWDVENGKTDKYKWPSDVVLKFHGVKASQGQFSKHSKQVLTLAVSSYSRYLTSGGLDRYVHLWDERTREHIQAFSRHKDDVSCLTFREGTAELFSGAYVRNIKVWNADDRAYIESLFGHSSDVIDIDCLVKERILAGWCDWTMELFNVPEGLRLRFLAPATTSESCRFIANDEFMSGSDNGSVESWNVNRKKHACIVKNAQAVMWNNRCSEIINVAEGSANHKENGVSDFRSYNCVSAQSWVSALKVSRGSDLAASGDGNGCGRLWAIESEANRIRPLYDLPLVGL